MRLYMLFYALAKLITSQRLGGNGWPDVTVERVW
jgi:hypothetical protein